jgi:hypothetical protein
MEKDDAEKLTIPHLVLASKDEPADVVAEYKRIIDGKGSGGEVESYGTMHHGWMGSRANFEDEANLKEFHRGYVWPRTPSLREILTLTSTVMTRWRHSSPSIFIKPSSSMGGLRRGQRHVLLLYWAGQGTMRQRRTCAVDCVLEHAILTRIPQILVGGMDGAAHSAATTGE